MDSKHRAELMVHLKDNFSKATDADAEMVWNDVRGVEFDDAQRAIIEHRREKGANAWRPDPQRIKSLAYKFLNDRRRDKSTERRTIDFIRRPDRPSIPFPAGRVPTDYNRMSDRDAIIHYFSDSWATVEEANGDPKGTAISRAYILSHCRKALTEIGMAQEDADALARECIDLRKGQRIPTVGVFGNVADVMKDPTSYDALKKLARAVRQNVPAVA